MLTVAPSRPSPAILRTPAAIAIWLGAALLLGTGAASFAATIVVPNGSFETPDIVFAAAYDPTSPSANPAPWKFTGSFQVGAFDNTASGSQDYIDNVDGAQVAFMLVGPGITLFQELTGAGATFEAGKSYTFTIGAGANSGTLNDAQLALRIYYLNGATKVTVATQSFPFNPLLDPGFINHLYDYVVTTPFLQAGNAALGKSIGIEIATPGDPSGGQGAYWDLDKARVESVPEGSSLLLALGGLAALGLSRPRTRRRA